MYYLTFTIKSCIVSFDTQNIQVQFILLSEKLIGLLQHWIEGWIQMDIDLWKLLSFVEGSHAGTFVM